jgi:hypothetical protein
LADEDPGPENFDSLVGTADNDGHASILALVRFPNNAITRLLAGNFGLRDAEQLFDRRGGVARLAC